MQLLRKQLRNARYAQISENLHHADTLHSGAAMLRRAALVTLTLASCDGYVVGPTRMGTTATAKAMRVSVAPAMNPLKNSIDGIVKGLADKFSENEKGFGLLKYSIDERTAQASHILFSLEDYPDDAEVDGMKMAAALKQKIEDGEFTFEFVAEKFSGDPTSSEKGGNLGTFKRGAMVPEFDEAVFKVDDDVPLGTLIGPVRTIYGHHLIKVVKRDEA